MGGRGESGVGIDESLKAAASWGKSAERSYNAPVGGRGSLVD